MTAAGIPNQERAGGTLEPGAELLRNIERRLLQLERQERPYRIVTGEYTPTLTNMVTTGFNEADYVFVPGSQYGLMNVTGRLEMVGTPEDFFTGSTHRISMPPGYIAATNVLNQPVGLCRFVDVGSAGYPGEMSLETANEVRFNARWTGAAYVRTAVLNSTIPFTWASGDWIDYSFTFQAVASA